MLFSLSYYKLSTIKYYDFDGDFGKCAHTKFEGIKSHQINVFGLINCSNIKGMVYLANYRDT